MPRHFTGGYAMPDGTTVEVTVKMEDGVPVVERFEVLSATIGFSPGRKFIGLEPESIRKATTALRHELPKVLAQWAPWVSDPHAPGRDRQALRDIRSAADNQLARRRLTPQLLREVAEVYRSAQWLPRQAVIDNWDIPPSTANRWIRAAREQGFLGAAPRPGVAGESESSANDA